MQNSAILLALTYVLGIILVQVIRGDMMKDASDMIRAAMAAEGVSISQLAKMVGRSSNAVSVKLKRGTMAAPAFFEFADKLGYEVILRKKETKEQIDSRRHGVGRRLRLMVGKVIYDTSKADAICHTAENDGWFIEIYKDDEGRFFAAHYTSWEGCGDYITTIGKEDAQRLYLAYGDGTADHYFEEAELKDTTSIR